MIETPIIMLDDQPKRTKVAKNLLKKINIIDNAPITNPITEKIKNLISISS